MVLGNRDQKSAISSKLEGLQTSDLVYRWSMMTRITDMHGDLQAESSGCLFKSHLREAGAYCVGQTACSVFCVPSLG